MHHGNETGLHGNETGQHGNETGLHGNETGLHGNETGLHGNETGLHGNETVCKSISVIQSCRHIPFPNRGWGVRCDVSSLCNRFLNLVRV